MHCLRKFEFLTFSIKFLISITNIEYAERVCGVNLSVNLKPFPLNIVYCLPSASMVL